MSRDLDRQDGMMLGTIWNALTTTEPTIGLLVLVAVLIYGLLLEPIIEAVRS